MEREKVTVLVVEDDRLSAELIKRLLARADVADFAVEHVERLAEGLARLAAPGIDLVLLDLMLPDAEGLEAVRRVCSAHPEVAVVVITALGCDLAVDAIRECAQDYLVKGRFSGEELVRAVRFAVERHKVKVRFQGVHAALRQATQTVSRLDALEGQVREKK